MQLSIVNRHRARAVILVGSMQVNSTVVLQPDTNADCDSPPCVSTKGHGALADFNVKKDKLTLDILLGNALGDGAPPLRHRRAKVAVRKETSALACRTAKKAAVSEGTKRWKLAHAQQQNQPGDVHSVVKDYVCSGSGNDQVWSRTQVCMSVDGYKSFAEQAPGTSAARSVSSVSSVLLVASVSSVLSIAFVHLRNHTWRQCVHKHKPRTCPSWSSSHAVSVHSAGASARLLTHARACVASLRRSHAQDDALRSWHNVDDRWRTHDQEPDGLP